MRDKQRHLGVIIRHTPDCQNVERTAAHVLQAARIVGLVASLSYEAVLTQADAERLEFPGSPTVIIDGVDLFETSRGRSGFACRIYVTERGFDGAPSVAQLVLTLGRFVR